MGQQQFKAGDEGATRGGLRYWVVAVGGGREPVMSVITMPDGKRLPFWHRADGRMNASDDPAYWLVPPAVGFSPHDR